MKNLKYIVSQLPGENGWYNDGHEKFMEVGEKMLAKGFSIDEVEIMLTDLYYAVSEEYGE